MWCAWLNGSSGTHASASSPRPSSPSFPLLRDAIGLRHQYQWTRGCHRPSATTRAVQRASNRSHAHLPCPRAAHARRTARSERPHALKPGITAPAPPATAHSPASTAGAAAPGSSLPAAARRGYTATSLCATLPLASRNSLVRDQCTVCLNPSGGAQRAQRAHRRFGSTQFRVGCGHTAALCGSWDVGARGGRPVARGVGRQRPGRRRAGVPRRRAAGRSERHEFCLKQNIPRSAPSTVVTQGRHGGRTGRLTTVTHVL